MLTGKRFELTRPVVAIATVDGKRVAVTIPAGVSLKAVSGPKDGERTVDVLWDGRLVAVFTTDLAARGIEIMDS